MIDIHQHLLWGIDDGADSAKTMYRMLLKASKAGIDTVFATAHARPGKIPFPKERYLQRIRDAKEIAAQKELKLQIGMGAEVLYSGQALKELNEGLIPTLNGTEFVLVEFYIDSTYSQILDGLRELSNEGYCPILAHVERYDCLIKQTEEKVQELKNFRVRLQMNAGTVIRNDRLFSDKTVKTMLKNDSIDYISSDAHGDSIRPINLSDAYRIICKKYGTERAEKLFEGNQRCDLLKEGIMA